MDPREYAMVLIREVEGGCSALVPDLPSAATQGETLEEALEMARDAIELEVMRDEGWPVPAARDQ